MKAALAALLNRPFFAAVGLIALGALVWFVGPLLTLGGWRPLGSDLSRWLAVTLCSAAAGAYVASRAAGAARQNRRLIDGLVAGAGPSFASPTAASTAAAPGAHDVAVIRKRFEEAIEQLKRTRLGGKRRLLAALAGQPYVYQLPWYVIIGAPGAGKTTALVNSGLRFPLAGKLGKGAVRGIGGTRNCDWWFTDEAVLIDTAGRFTTQDSDRAADQAGWFGFLDLLRRYRPRRPINGVLLTVSVSDLLNASNEERLAHARKLRERLDELHTRLGIGLPIYVLVTKADLLAGFMEFFADFDKDERAQVWGVTLPYGPAAEGIDPLVRMAPELAALEKRLDECLIDRLRGESDRERRAAIYAFPQQWRVLRETLHGFLQDTFAGVHDERRTLVRGVYFTSATQEGTPMDRALGGLARALGLASRIIAPARPSGKTFFVTRLLRDVVFAEAGLAGTNVRWKRRRAVLEWGAVGATTLLVGIALALALRAYASNRAYVDDVATRLQTLDGAVAAAKRSAPTDLVALVPVLDALAGLQASSAAAPTRPTMGLDQREKFGAAAHDVYRRLLKEALLPRIAARLEERLRAGSKERVEMIYEALKAYVMLFGGRNFDAAALRGYLSADWEATLPASAGLAQHDALRRHLDQLLAGGEVGAPTQADQKVIAAARGLVDSVPLAQRVYTRLKAIDAGAAPFSVASAAGPFGAQVFVRASGRPLSDGVPALYSRAVLERTFQARSREVLRQFAAERSWVLGGAAAVNVAAAPADGRDARDDRLRDEIERLYRADYERVWDEFLRDLRIVVPDSLAAGAQLAQILARTDSPLAALLIAADRELAIERGAPPARFESLHRFVIGPSPSLQEALALVAKLSAHLAAVDDAVKRNVAVPASDVTRELAALAARAPEPARGIFTQLATTSAGQIFAAVRAPLGRQMTAEIAAPCARAVEGRYPLVRTGSEEISRADFVRTFAAGGLIDGFFQRHLAPHVDTATWTYAGAGERAQAPEALQQFRRAQFIRDALFRDAGRTLGARFEFKLLEMDAGVDVFALEIDDQIMRFRRDARDAQAVLWPGPAAATTATSRVRVVIGTAAAGDRGYSFEGPWALLRMFDRVRIEQGAAPERVVMTFDVEGRRARFEVTSTVPLGPARVRELEQFRCPRQL
jgi:type VI secretion system protein ImpL